MAVHLFNNLQETNVTIIYRNCNINALVYISKK